MPLVYGVVRTSVLVAARFRSMHFAFRISSFAKESIPP